jgi:CDGSH-type Zn-finger protein
MSEHPQIFINPNSGSMRFTGEADFVDADGNILETRSDFKLCGCGKSKEKPFCDGSHKDKSK